ncbi:uncharacterized protein LOC143426198 isoform X3 [Xylocopa sonorina]|uniref:uncharacterized protein LOC143426198 isoform X3 n=1 Tax=Xylocopa sonorina TaxID=1818115 RepID=UPI00403A899A
MFFPLMHSPPANQVPLSYGPAGSLAERHELRASMIAFCMIIDRSKIETASHTEVEREESYRKIQYVVNSRRRTDTTRTSSLHEVHIHAWLWIACIQVRAAYATKPNV